MKINVLNVQLLAQIIHVSVGLGVVWLAALLYYFKDISLITTFVTFFIIIILKETVFDPIVEKEPFLWGGAFDYSMYCVGVMVSVFITLWIVMQHVL